MPLVRKAHRDPRPIERPQLLDQAILVLMAPLARQELDDLFSSGYKLGAIAPHAIDRIRQRDLLRIARVPSILRLAYLCGGGFARKRGNQTGRGLCRHLCCSFSFQTDELKAILRASDRMEINTPKINIPCT